jgi:exodeoxyribonuclease-3
LGAAVILLNLGRRRAVRIATYNVNGVNGRLANLLEWLGDAAPDIICLQELKAPDDKFPVAAIRAAGYGAAWHGQKSWNGVAILARGGEPIAIRRGLPGDPDDTHSRYIEAAVDGMIVGSLYMPNGNPAPRPRFPPDATLFRSILDDHLRAGDPLRIFLINVGHRAQLLTRRWKPL